MAAVEKEQEVVRGAGEEQSADRRHVEALLRLSEEEDFLRDMQPQQYHLYSGWEEAVRGWARVAPMSCILLTQKTPKKAKCKKANNLTPSSLHPTIPNAESLSSIAESRCDSHVGSHNSFKRSTPLHQQAGSWTDGAIAAQQMDSTMWRVPSAMQKTPPTVLLREKIEEEATLSGTHYLSLSENRPSKPQRQGHRPKSKVVPIKIFTLPPIEFPYLHPQQVTSYQLCSGRKAAEGQTTEDNCFMFVEKSGLRGTRLDPAAHPEPYSAPLTSKYQTCGQNPHLFSALRVSIPKRHQVPVTSTSNTVHHPRYSMGKSPTRALQQVHKPLSGPARGCVASGCMKALK